MSTLGRNLLKTKLLTSKWVAVENQIRMKRKCSIEPIRTRMFDGIYSYHETCVVGESAPLQLSNGD